MPCIKTTGGYVGAAKDDDIYKNKQISRIKWGLDIVEAKDDDDFRLHLDWSMKNQSCD